MQLTEKNMTYEIKTHNPWVAFVLIIGAIILSSLLFHNRVNYATEIFFALIFIFGSLTIYFFNSEIIEVTISEKGINTQWMTLPFFTKIDKEILWTDIKYWNFQQSRMMNAFIIKTNEDKSFSIRSLNIYSRQKALSAFVDNFMVQIEPHNLKHSPSLFATTFGKVFAIIMGLFLIVMTYCLITIPSIQLDGRMITIYIGGLFVIGMTIQKHLSKNKE